MASAPRVDRHLPERMLLTQGWARVAGVDEAGRGPLAGPVVAAAVVFPPAWIRDGVPIAFRALNDSKQLTARQRNDFFEKLTSTPGIEFGIARVEAAEIDRINILQATHQAMRAALKVLKSAPEYVLVDGQMVPNLGWPQTALVKGDSLSYSIAAASVLAKVTRDREMESADRRWPHYGFARHKGYGTVDHLAAIAAHGPCPLHRQTFAPFRRAGPELIGV